MEQPRRKISGQPRRTVTLFRKSGKVSRRRRDLKIIITARFNVLLHSAVHEDPSLRQCYAMSTVFQGAGEITLTQKFVNYLPCKNLGFHNGERSRTFEVLHNVTR